MKRHEFVAPVREPPQWSAMEVIGNWLFVIGSLHRHDLRTRSQRQSTQGCGAAQRPGANGRPTGQGRGDCTVFQQPPCMRTFGVQGCNALAVGVSGAAARP
jgi:hypothetical protein